MFLNLAVGLRQGKRRDIILEASFFFAERNGGSAAGRELRDQSLPQEAFKPFPIQAVFLFNVEDVDRAVGLRQSKSIST